MILVHLKKYLGILAFVTFFFLTTSEKVLAYSDSEINNLLKNTFSTIYLTCFIALLLNFILILFQIKRKQKINLYQFILSIINSLVCLYFSIFVFWRGAIYIDHTNSNGKNSDFILILISIMLGSIILILNFIYKNKGDGSNEN